MRVVRVQGHTELQGRLDQGMDRRCVGFGRHPFGELGTWAGRTLGKVHCKGAPR